MGSDHLPIVMSVDCQIVTLQPPPITELRWNWKKADFVGFSKKLDDTIKNTPISLEEAPIDVRTRFLNDAMLSAAKAHIGKVKASTNSKEWLSKEIREAIKLRNRLRRSIASNRKEWITACREVQSMIRESKEEKLKEFISESDHSNDPNKIWTKIKALSGKSASSIRNETLVHNGKCFTSSRTKANAFMHRYAEISRLDIPKSSRRKKPISRMLNAPSVAEESCQAFNPAELSVAIKSMKPKGAPGRDRIAPRFINSLGPVALSFMLTIFNDSWCSGSCPLLWREAIIIPLLKKGKPASQINSFRPVSLTSCVAKTMERMVANRMSNLAERSGWWCEDQAGFRSMRSCEDQVLWLSQSISDGFQSKQASRTVLALLDFSKAYDTVWRERLF